MKRDGASLPESQSRGTAGQTGHPPDAAAARLKTALALHQQGRLDQAEAFYQEILRSQPRHFDATQLLAMIATQRKDSARAVDLFDSVLRINPDHAESHNNRGIALLDLKRPEDALVSYERALAFKPDYAEAHWNESLCRLLMSDFERGWPKFESRWKTEPWIGKLRAYAQPLWLGEVPIVGKTYAAAC